MVWIQEPTIVTSTTALDLTTGSSKTKQKEIGGSFSEGKERISLDLNEDATYIQWSIGVFPNGCLKSARIFGLLRETYVPKAMFIILIGENPSVSAVWQLYEWIYRIHTWNYSWRHHSFFSHKNIFFLIKYI